MRSVNLQVESGFPYYNGGGLPLGELRNAVPSGESALAVIREKARDYNLKSLKAEMLYHLDRYAEAAEVCSGLVPEGWFCRSARESAASHLGEFDVNELYQAGKYEEGLVASTLAIQRARNFTQKADWSFARQYHQRALIEVALGQIELALQDFNKASAIKSALPPELNGIYDKMGFQEAIVLYVYGAPSAGEQICATFAKSWTIATSFCVLTQYLPQPFSR